MEGGAPATPGSRELAPPGEAGRAPSNARSRFVTIIQEPGRHWYRWKIDARASVCMNRKKQLLRDRRRCFTMMTLSLRRLDLPAVEIGCGVNEEFVIAFSTFPDRETAQKIARELVENAVVACANIMPSVESIYFWKEKVETSAEVLTIFKMTAARYSEFETQLRM